MGRTTSILSALLGMAMTFALASAAQATATRTYVSSTGDDTNTATSCPRANPCAHFANAYSVTQAGGEIIALDLGAYGPLTITTPLSINALVGAIITVQTGTVGITVTAGAGNYVILRNFQISGAAGSSSTTGIKLNTGRLILQNSSLRGLTDGLLADSTNNSASVIRAYLADTDIIGNTRGVRADGTGTDLFGGSPPHGGNVEVLLWRGNVLGNGTAFRTDHPGHDGNGNYKPTIWIGTIGNAVGVNIQGNAVVGSGSPVGDCATPATCQARTYNPSNQDPQDPDPTLTGP